MLGEDDPRVPDDTDVVLDGTLRRRRAWVKAGMNVFEESNAECLISTCISFILPTTDKTADQTHMQRRTEYKMQEQQDYVEGLWRGRS